VSTIIVFGMLMNSMEVWYVTGVGRIGHSFSCPKEWKIKTIRTTRKIDFFIFKLLTMILIKWE
jgi:hypothetical protein